MPNTLKPKSAQSFEKSARLLCASDYKPVFDKALIKASNASLLILARPNNLGQARLGLVVAKKNIKLAHRRNRFKRVLRESFRQQQNLPTIDVIVLARKNADNLTNSELFSTLEELWKRVAKKAQRLVEKEG
jgi:ribonuclease P protein component